MSSSYLDPQLGKVLRLVPSTAADAYYDYCLEPYAPRRSWSDKYRSENLLWHSLLVGDAERELDGPLRAIQASLGRDLTVWGVKWDGTRLWWEVYFYDPKKEDPRATLSSLTEVLAPFVAIGPRVDERTPYMMVSFDLDAAVVRRGTIEHVSFYLTGETAHAGRAYEASASGRELTNTYRFFEAKRDVDEVLALLKSSVFTDWSRRETLGKVVPPELWACKKICVAKKRRTDAIYFSGIAVEQLAWFLERYAYPRPLVDFVTRHQARFEHLFFDVGIDYRWDAERDELTYVKTSYYGTL